MQTLLSDSVTPPKAQYVAVYYDLPIIDVEWDEIAAYESILAAPRWEKAYERAHVLSLSFPQAPQGLLLVAQMEGSRLYAVHDALILAEEKLSSLDIPDPAVKATRVVLGKYYSRIGYVPDWGDLRFSEENRIVYTLYGPSRDACLRIGEKRKVCQDSNGQYIYGPKIT